VFMVSVSHTPPTHLAFVRVTDTNCVTTASERTSEAVVSQQRVIMICDPSEERRSPLRISCVSARLTCHVRVHTSACASRILISLFTWEALVGPHWSGLVCVSV
jgi:hypothetical protein